MAISSQYIATNNFPAATSPGINERPKPALRALRAAPDNQASILGMQPTESPAGQSAHRAKEHNPSTKVTSAARMCLNEARAKDGYLVGLEDMEPEVARMIERGFLSSHAIMEQFDIMSVKFDDLKKELVALLESKLENARFETRGALTQQFTYLEETSSQNEVRFNKNKEMVENIQLQFQLLTFGQGPGKAGATPT